MHCFDSRLFDLGDSDHEEDDPYKKKKDNLAPKKDIDPKKLEEIKKKQEERVKAQEEKRQKAKENTSNNNRKSNKNNMKAEAMKNKEGSRSEPEQDSKKYKLPGQIDQIDVNTLENTEKLVEERYYGKIEYKLMLVNKSEERIQGLCTQMKFRLEEGEGECIYIIGVDDFGNPLGISEEEMRESLKTLEIMAMRLGAELRIFYWGKGQKDMSLICQVSCNKKMEEKNKYFPKKEIKIGLLGEGDTGKSTLVGVILDKKLDNGKGSARLNVFKHRHELLCGKSSSISHQIIGFDEAGEIYGKTSWNEIIDKSVKILNFYDMGGSEEYFKNTLGALSPKYYDYLLLTISAFAGVTKQTEYFLNLAKNLDIPIIIVITKIDFVAEEDLDILEENLKNKISQLEMNKIPLKARSEDDIVLYSNTLTHNIIPYFEISNTKGTNLQMLIHFLRTMPFKPKETLSTDNENELNVVFEVTKSYVKEKKKTIEKDIILREKEKEALITKSYVYGILIGIMAQGELMVGSQYKLGPFPDGSYRTINIFEIRCNTIKVKHVFQGQFCSIAFTYADESLVKIDDLRKGMVILNTHAENRSVKSFEAEIWSIGGDKTPKGISYKFQPVVNITPVVQSVKIVKVLTNHNDTIQYSTEEKYEEIAMLRRIDSTKKDNEEAREIDSIIGKPDEIKVNAELNVFKNTSITSNNENTTNSASSGREIDLIQPNPVVSVRERKKTYDDIKESKRAEALEYKEAKELKERRKTLEGLELKSDFSPSENEFIIYPDYNRRIRVIFEFMYNPEYISIGSHLMINSQSIKAYGRILNVFQ